MNAVVLRPAPRDRRRRTGWSRCSRPAATARLREQGSYARYAYLRDRSRTLDGVAAWGRVSLTIAAGGEGTTVLGNMVSGNYFDVLGVRPAARPVLRRRRGSHAARRIPSSSSRTRSGRRGWAGEPSAIGRTVLVNGAPFTVIGVAPREFRGIYTGLQHRCVGSADDAAAAAAAVQPDRPRPGSGCSAGCGTASDADAAQRELEVLTTACAAESGQPHGAAEPSRHRVSRLTGLPNGEGTATARVHGPAARAPPALVLLIAGVNVAAMLSARYAARAARDGGARGARRRPRAAPPAADDGSPRAVPARRHRRLRRRAARDGGAGAAAAARQRAARRSSCRPTCGCWRSRSASRSSPASSSGSRPRCRRRAADITSRLREDSAGSGVRRTFVSRALIVGQLALSLVLLVAAGLFMRALDQRPAHRSGLRRRRASPWPRSSPSRGATTRPGRARSIAALRERVEALPGVTAVSYTGRVPLMMGSSPDDITVDGVHPMCRSTSRAWTWTTSRSLRLPLAAGPRISRSRTTSGRRAWR